MVKRVGDEESSCSSNVPAPERLPTEICGYVAEVSNCIIEVDQTVALLLYRPR